MCFVSERFCVDIIDIQLLICHFGQQENTLILNSCLFLIDLCIFIVDT